MGLYIRDEEVKALAKRLAERRRCTVTEAVRGAIRAELERDERARTDRWRELRELQAEIAAMPDLRPDFTDKDLYDEQGLPIR